MLAFTRAVPRTLANCELTHVTRTPLDLHRAVEQHEEYERLLAALGCDVRRLPELPGYPDSVFVEDTAVILDELAVIARPGAPSRRGETTTVAAALGDWRPLRRIESPGTLDGGDVLRSGRDLYVGLSTRTNRNGVDQMAEAVRPFGYVVRPVTVTGCLHLKSAASTVGDRVVLLDPRYVERSVFANLTTIDVDSTEPHAANVLFVNGTVICPANAPRTQALLRARHYQVAAVDASELAKAEAGLTCCSLLLNDAADRRD